jgi:hypothetical protein
MRPLLILASGFALTAVSCELMLRSRKLQSALGRVAILHAAVLAIVAGFLAANGLMRLVPVSIFWSGALLAWFGFRSHVESSILLRMIHLLGSASMTRRELTSLYNARYGRTERIEELIRAGLVSGDRARTSLVPTRKGLLIARLVLRLR